MGRVGGPAHRRKLLDDLKLSATVGGSLAFLALLGGTYRVRRTGRTWAERRRAGEGARCIYAVWHRDIWNLLRTMRDQGLLVLTSEHRDGEMATRVVNRLGYATLRGSSTHGGVRALMTMARAAREGQHDPLFTVDGPRGPALQVKPGIAYAASRSGLPVVPLGVAIDRTWQLGSWDRHRIAKPFARVEFVIGEPIEVPAEASTEELDGRWVAAITEGLHGAESVAQGLLAQRLRA
jgi:lysophospholipid acyltransferase (LPLAT)-like uncharacterized protein